MYFQTQRELWCHVITGALPNASILSEAYQTWVSMGKFEQNIAKNKIEICSWNSPAQSPEKQCTQRLFKIRCVCLIKSFEAWSRIQDYQGACGVNPVSVRITMAQEQEIMEMLRCFTELVKCVQKEKQNCILLMQSQPLNDDSGFLNYHKQSILSKCLGKTGSKTRTTTGVDENLPEKVGAGDHQLFSHDSDVLKGSVNAGLLEQQEAEVDAITSGDFPPQEFDVDDSSDESSVEGSCQSDDETESKCSGRSSSSIDSGGDAPNNCGSSGSKEFIAKYSLNSNEGFESLSSFSRSNPFCTIPDKAECNESDDDFESRVEARMSQLQINSIIKSYQDERNECDDSEGENDATDNTSSGYEFIDPENEDPYSYLYDDFEYDLPPRPKTS